MSTKFLYKFKACRSLGQNIWPTRKLTSKQKFTLLKIKKKKLSHFGLQLQCRRFLSILYGKLSRSQFKKIYTTALKLKGQILNNFLSLLERRLDSVIFRMKLCSTFRASRQLILHKFVYVNNKLVTRPSFFLSPGDIISIGSLHGFQNLRLSESPFAITNTQLISFDKDYEISKSNNKSQLSSFNRVELHSTKSNKNIPYLNVVPDHNDYESNRNILSVRETITKQKRIFHLVHNLIKCFDKNFQSNTKVLHLEVNYKLLIGIFLYTPQQIIYPAHFDINFILKS